MCFQLFTLTFSFYFLPTYALYREIIVCIYVLKLLSGDCGKSDVVGEIRTGFLAVFLTSFNFSTPV